MGIGPFRGVATSVVVVTLAMGVTGCGFADDRREAVGASVPPTVEGESERTVRPSVETTLPPPISLPSESPVESVPPAPDQIDQIGALSGDAEIDSGFFEAMAEIGPQCPDLIKLIFASKQVFDEGAAPSFDVLREQMVQVLVQVRVLIGGLPAPVVGSDQLAAEIDPMIGRVSSAGTEREVYDPMLGVLERHSAVVDEVFSSLNRTCQLAVSPEQTRPAVFMREWFRSEIARLP